MTNNSESGSGLPPPCGSFTHLLRPLGVFEALQNMGVMAVLRETGFDM